MNRAFKTEFYPDMPDDIKDRNWGKKVVTLSCAVNNGKRFKSLSEDERAILVDLISVFQEQLTGFKNEILTKNKIQ